MDTQTICKPDGQKTFNRVGFAMSVAVMLSILLQVLFEMIPIWIWGQDVWQNAPRWGSWFAQFGPVYFIALPVASIILSTLPANRPEKKPLSFGKLMMFFPICYALTMAGNLIGNMLSMLFSLGRAQNHVVELTSQLDLWNVFALVVLAPVWEELLCRKLLLDRIRHHGEKLAAFVSALLFGLLHRNLFQFFYAFALGYLLSYIYLRTGKVWYTIVLHGLMNLVGGVLNGLMTRLIPTDISLLLDSMGKEEFLQLMRQLSGLIFFGMYAMLLMGLVAVGVVLLIRLLRNQKWEAAAQPLAKGTVSDTVFFNAGMLLFVMLCLFNTIYALF